MNNPTPPDIDTLVERYSTPGVAIELAHIADAHIANDACDLARAYRAQAERIKALEGEKEALLKTKFLSCPGPNALVVVDDYETMGWWSSHEIEACHPHQIVLRAAFESDISEAREQYEDLRQRAKADHQCSLSCDMGGCYLDETKP